MTRTTSTTATMPAPTVDEYAAAQARAEATERTYADAEAEVTRLHAIVPPSGSPAFSVPASALERVQARQALPAAQAALDVAWIARDEARIAVAALEARAHAARDAEFEPREDALLNEMLALARQLEGKAAAYRVLENAHALACGRRRPIDAGTSRLHGAWDRSEPGRTSWADNLQSQLEKDRRRRAERAERPA